MKKYRKIFQSGKQNALKESLLMNGYYGLELFRFIGIAIIVIGVMAAAIIGTLNFFVPEKLQYMDEMATIKLFDQLQAAKKHHDAIAVMEYKGSFLNDSPKYLDYRSKLSDSYVAVGDYSNAENQLLTAWNMCDSLFQTEFLEDESLEGTPFEEMDIESAKDMIKFDLSRQIYQLYEKMGDAENMKNFFTINSRAYHNSSDKLKAVLTQFDSHGRYMMDDLYKLDSIVVISLTDKSQAIPLMTEYVDRIIESDRYNLTYKMKCISRLIRWELDCHYQFEAYNHIYQATALVKMMRTSTEYGTLGDLADYLLEIHDIPLSKAVASRYQMYVGENYVKTDHEYLKQQIRMLKYKELDGDWDGLVDGLVSYCEGMKKHILTNIVSMTEGQREYYVQEFDMGYDMAFEALHKSNSQELANLCFENVAFKNGLLLRSNKSLENRIRLSNDKESLKMYKELRDCQAELAYQDVSTRLFTQSSQLRKRIDELEKTLALKYTNFKTKNEMAATTLSDIQTTLTDNAAVALLVEKNGELFSLTLMHKGDVAYDFIGNKADIASKLEDSIDELYHDKGLTDYLWGKLRNRLKHTNKVYYQPLGLFAQLSPAALYDGNERYLCDTWNFVLVGNPTDVTKHTNGLHLATNSQKQHFSLWGGIDYGDNENLAFIEPIQKRSAITRGEKLVNLKYAYQEVSDISEDLRSQHQSYTLYSGTNATEKEFKKLSSKNNYIIHISTHGFFNDKGTFSDPMLESGLFFAGSNKYWSNDSVSYAYSDKDGILRSAEISQLNLSSCALVVLSACETGLGFTDSSEGIYGLQRAFKLAGVGQILMSLWDVDDRATAMLMTEFYRNLLKGEGANVALSNSQRELRMQGYSPEQWGAFVLLQ